MSQKSYDHTCYNSRTTYLSTLRFLIEIMFILKTVKTHFKGYMISSWSFHIKFFFLKLAECSFHKFHMK